MSHTKVECPACGCRFRARKKHRAFSCKRQPAGSDVYFRNEHGVDYRIHLKKDGRWQAQKKFLWWWTDYMTENFEWKIWNDRDDALFDIEITDWLTIIDPND